GVLGDYDVTLNIVVRHQRSGLTKCTKGTYNCVVEEATVTQEYSFEGTPLLSATQREFTWVSDEGYIIAQWTEDLDAGGQPTGNMFGKQLTDYTLP
ncbi:MAG TPA: hypothetical protein VEI97_00145, partial [bacterium]|nr:hypothetical protein [bacterium]